MPSRKRHQGKARKEKQRSEPKGLVKKCKHFLDFPALDSSLDTLKCREFVSRELSLLLLVHLDDINFSHRFPYR